MKHLDYVTEDDIFELSDQEYESFRAYLRFIGHNIHPQLGVRRVKIESVLVLYNGDLVWSVPHEPGFFTNRISLDEVKRMAALGTYYEQV